jgi:hypothetical protein
MIEVHGFDLEVVNDGDDGGVIGEQSTLKRVEEVLVDWFARFGYVVVAEPVANVFEDIEFCQCHPVNIAGEWRMVRDPRTAIDKDLACIRPVRNKQEYDFYRGAISECGRNMAGDIPMWGALYQVMGSNLPANWRYNRHGRLREEPVTGMTFLAKGMSAQYAEPDLRTRLSFSRAFGIPVHVQKAYERRVRAHDLSYSTPSERYAYINILLPPLGQRGMSPCARAAQQA